jgi:hypothetical protein
VTTGELNFLEKLAFHFLIRINAMFRMIFAVVTTSSVVLYDTQHTHPIAKIGGCHLATINDAGTKNAKSF